MTTVQSALVALIPAADHLVAEYRSRLDSGAQLGVPAHVTVLFPFLPPDLITSDVRSELGALIGRHAPFDVSFESLGWFDDLVAHLQPNPAEPFRRLTASIWRNWPECPPYGGAHAEPIPHLTIGDGGRSPELEAAAVAIERSLPFSARIDALHLMTGTDEPASWTRQATFPLGLDP